MVLVVDWRTHAQRRVLDHAKRRAISRAGTVDEQGDDYGQAEDEGQLPATHQHGAGIVADGDGFMGVTPGGLRLGQTADEADHGFDAAVVVVDDKVLVG